MAWHQENPRVTALIAVAVGAVALALVVAMGGVTMPRGGTRKSGALLLGFAGLALGVGLAQLAWPPVPDTGNTGKTAFGRASWPQKLLWIFGGMVGIVIAAVVQTVASGKY